MVAGLQGWPLSPAHKTGAAHNRLAVSGHFRSRQEAFRPEHDGGKYQPTGLKCLSPLTRFPNTARPGYAPWQRRFLFVPYTRFSAMVPENVTNKTFHLFVANDMFFSEYEASSSWQDGGCATHNPHPARGLRPLDTRNARRCASRIPKAKT